MHQWFIRYCLLLLVLTGATIGWSQSCPPSGDVDLDGMITPQDALRVFEYHLGAVLLSPCARDAANVAGFGVTKTVDTADALCVFRHFLGEPSCIDRILASRHHREIGPVTAKGRRTFFLGFAGRHEWLEVFAEFYGRPDTDRYKVGVPARRQITVAIRTRAIDAQLRRFSHAAACLPGRRVCRLGPFLRRIKLHFDVTGRGSRVPYIIDIVVEKFTVR